MFRLNAVFPATPTTAFDAGSTASESCLRISEVFGPRVESQSIDFVETRHGNEDFISTVER